MKLCSYHIIVLISIWLRTNELKWSAKHKMTSRTISPSMCHPSPISNYTDHPSCPARAVVPATIAPALCSSAHSPWTMGLSEYAICYLYHNLIFFKKLPSSYKRMLDGTRKMLKWDKIKPEKRVIKPLCINFASANNIKVNEDEQYITSHSKYTRNVMRGFGNSKDKRINDSNSSPCARSAS